MKPIKSIICLWLAVIVLIVSCKKDPVTKEVKFTSTTYTSLGSVDADGKPTYLSTPDVVSGSLMTFFQNTLPERTDLRTTHPEYLTTSAIADVKITQTSKVFITYVSQGTKFNNAFAFYTYPTGKSPASAKDIDKITYIFPNCGGSTTLQTGDKVEIGTFEAGTSIGFVLLQDGWDNTTHKNNNDAVHFCSNDVLNPEVNASLKKHAVLINSPENKVLIGFEDLNRTLPECDNDFNDLVVYCTVENQ